MKALRFFLLLSVALFCSVCANAKLYAVCVGINHYASPTISDLYFAEKDCNSVASFLKKESGDGSIYILNGKNATRYNIMQALNKISRVATANDVVMFYFSGHGADGGMAVYDTGVKRTGILSYRDLSNIFKKSKVRNKIIFADTCHAGSGKLTNESNRNTEYLSKQNILLFLSSRANENSIENRYLGCGIFTQHLLDGLRGKADANRDRAVTARELFDYVSPRVIRDTQSEQHPVMWGNFDPQLILIAR